MSKHGTEGGREVNQFTSRRGEERTVTGSAGKSDSQRSRSFDYNPTLHPTENILLRRKSAPPMFVVRPESDSIQFHSAGKVATLMLSKEKVQSLMDDLTDAVE